MDLASRLGFAVAVAREAGNIALGYFRNPDLVVEKKADLSPVTRADREAEALLVRRIRAAYPEDGILGEELGESPSQSGDRWILDPIDGTRSFARGVPLFGTLVALEHAGQIVIGVIHLPACGETVYAATGEGTWWRTNDDSPVRARVSGVDSLSHALCLCTSPEGLVKRGREGALRELGTRCASIRTWGDCYGYALVATGRADVMIDPAMAVWDAAALLPVLQEAGGVYTDWTGKVGVDGGNAVASNGLLHEEALKIMSGNSR
jgi:histidinol-phosphatase